MKFKVFKLNKNKRFNYTPRYYDGKDIGNVYDFDSKIVKYRDAVNSRDFGAQWQEARKASRHRGNREINTRLLVIFLILVLLVLWFFDFDLSVFIPRK